MKNDFFRQMFQPENKKTLIWMITICVLGIVLLYCSSHWTNPKEDTTQAEQTIPQNNQRPEQILEEEMERILSQIAGAGEVEVMLTYRSTQEHVPATEQIIEETTREGENTKKEEQHMVLLEQENGQTPMILTELAPQVEGVVIVAQGAGDAVVCNSLHQAAQALLQVPSHKIAIIKMKS